MSSVKCRPFCLGPNVLSYNTHGLDVVLRSSQFMALVYIDLWVDAGD